MSRVISLRPILGVAILAIGASLAAEGATTRPVDISNLCNVQRQALCCNSIEYPGGFATYLGVPFNLGPSDSANTVYPAGTGTVTVTIPINRKKVSRVFSLMNSAWGAPGPVSYLKVEFETDLGDIASFDLVGNVHIRDHAQTEYTCCIDPIASPTHTQNAWSSSNVRADMQTFELPPAFSSSTLTEIRIIDSGSDSFQRALLFALTAEDTNCYADLTDDDLVEDADFVVFLQGYNLLDCADPEMPVGCPADLNFDGVVDDSDFTVFVLAYDALLCP